MVTQVYTNYANFEQIILAEIQHVFTTLYLATLSIFYFTTTICNISVVSVVSV